MTPPADRAIQLLRRSAEELTRGLSAEEIDAVERRFGVHFSEDHRAFLLLHLPIGDGWPNWRSGDPADLESRLAWPVDGVLSHVDDGEFWPQTWGPRPDDSPAALAVARQRLAAVPTLVPVYSHRYLPAAPVPSPAPVFSVYQTDVICYGADLGDYIAREFGPRDQISARTAGVRVPFWSDLAEGADDEDL